MRRHDRSGTGSVCQQLQKLVAAFRRRSGPALSRGRPGRAPLCFEPLESRQLLAGDLIMVNDHVAGPGTHVNATSFAGNGIRSGLLNDLATGQETAITLSVTGSGVSYESMTGTPAPGTDAYTIFNGLVDFRPASGASLAISNSDTYTHALSGLNPDATYDFAGTAVRGNTGYTNRWTLVTLVGVYLWQHLILVLLHENYLNIDS